MCRSNACVYSCLTLRQLHTVNFDLSVRSGSSRTTNPLTFYYFGELAFYDFRKTNWKCAVTALYSPWDIGTIGQQHKLTRENVLYFIVFCFIASFSPILCRLGWAGPLGSRLIRYENWHFSFYDSLLESVNKLSSWIYLFIDFVS